MIRTVQINSKQYEAIISGKQLAFVLEKEKDVELHIHSGDIIQFINTESKTEFDKEAVRMVTYFERVKDVFIYSIREPR